jgi:citrate lyase beta subunit
MDLRHFSWLTDEEAQRLFYRSPVPIDREASVDRLAVFLGATLYMPATRSTIAKDLLALGRSGLTSAVLCLEDAIPDNSLKGAEENLVVQLDRYYSEGFLGSSLPLVFVRVRDPEQIGRLVAALGAAGRHLTGFVLPKFDPTIGREFLEEVRLLSIHSGVRYLSMPVVETTTFMHLESRIPYLLDTRRLLAEYPEQVLGVRFGVTDLLSLYGMRRGPETTVYDIPLIAGALSDLLNVLGRFDGGHAVSGPVWEHFAPTDRVFKPQLRQTPFEARHASQLRQSLLTNDMDGLIREVLLDRANGLVGKTVIHPSHVLPVHALSVVPYEEFQDAVDIVSSLASGGVMASQSRNKMNEGKPHATWAKRTLLRAEVFGVAAPEVSFVEFLQAGYHQP